jgi:hypothetical protein
MGIAGPSCGFLNLLVLMIFRLLNDCCQWRESFGVIIHRFHKQHWLDKNA